MGDLISRKALIERCKGIAAHEWNKRASPVSWSDAYEQFADDVEAAPSVDAVEVVRCKDCIHWYEPEEVCLKIYSDGAVSQYAWQNRNPDDFCNYGERRGKGEC